MDSLKHLKPSELTILTPNRVKIPTFLADYSTIPYKIFHGKVYYDELAIKNVYHIYAPGLIGIWLQSNRDWKTHPETKLLTDNLADFNNLQKQFIRFRLLYEKFRLGSDVPSPLLTRISYQYGYYHMIKDIYIGEWLRCFNATPNEDDIIII